MIRFLKKILKLSMHVFLLSILVSVYFQCSRSQREKQEKVIGISSEHVELLDDFWRHRVDINRKITIPHTVKQLEATGIIDNFRSAAVGGQGIQNGNYPFEDSDAYKVIEGIAYSLRSYPDTGFSRILEKWIPLIGAAQERDGYLFTARTNQSEKLIGWAGATRWSRLSRSHELYNAGHLYEAACAYFATTGAHDLLNVARKNAELVLKTFGKEKIEIPPGHQEIEIGLLKLHQLSGDSRYVDLARFFLEARGKTNGKRILMQEYAQDHLPIFEQTEVVGHAVRAPYMYAAMTDIYRLTGDVRYKKSVDSLWKNLVTKKLHITGGLGSVGMGESFGKNYELPNMTAYNETCASIANILWQYRMFLLYADARYVDVLERTLYNAFLSGVSLDGDTFFYDNPLASKGQHKRRSWFYCNCCISNICRFLPTLAGYIYATRGEDVYVNLFVSSQTEVGSVNPVHIEQVTDYPFDGTVKIMIDPRNKTRFTLYVRIPGWVGNMPVPGDLYHFFKQTEEKPDFILNGEAISVPEEKGYAKFDRIWEQGDSLVIQFPMPVRWITAHSLVKENQERIALQRGPLVFCLEGVDQPDGRVLNTVVNPGRPVFVEIDSTLLNGIPVITGAAFGTEFIPGKPNLKINKKSFYAIPYYAWAHRGRTEMGVWLAAQPDKTEPLNAPEIAELSTVSTSGGSDVQFLNDKSLRMNPESGAYDYFYWDNSKDTAWVQYEFIREESVSKVKVYWVKNREIHFPLSWRILARFDGQMRPVWNPDRNWGIDKQGLSIVYFETVKTDAIRLEAVLPSQGTSGIAEWSVY